MLGVELVDWLFISVKMPVIVMIFAFLVFIYILYVEVGNLTKNSEIADQVMNVIFRCEKEGMKRTSEWINLPNQHLDQQSPHDLLANGFANHIFQSWDQLMEDAKDKGYR